MDIAGKKVPKWALYGGIGVAVVGGVYFFKNRSSSSSSSTASTSIDPVTGLPYSQDNQVDPVTGLTYLAEAQQYGSVQAAEAAVSGGSAPGAGYTGYNGYSTSNVGGTTTPSSTPTTYATNGQWSQAAQDYLTNTVGLAASDVSKALGDYINGRPVQSGSAEYSIIQQAIAFTGDPPVNGPNQDPPGINVSAAPPPTNGGGSTGGQVKQFPAPTALHVTAKYPGAVQVQWDMVTGAQNYSVATYQQNGKKVSGPFDSNGPTANIGGLHAGWTYHTQVWANGGQLAPPGATVTYTLPK